MARAGINRSSLRTTISSQMGRSLRRRIISKTQRDIEAAVKLMLREFDNHPVTKELEDGSKASNLSNTLGGIGNLFSFIGFEEGDKPIAPVRKILSTSTKLVSVVQKKGRLDFEVVIDLPSKDSIAMSSPVPWAAARSWVLGIERGLSGLGQFLVKPGAGRSGGGIQIAGQLRGGSFKNKKYISAILNSLQVNLMRMLKS